MSPPKHADVLNTRIDCEDLAYRLGLERPGDRGNFKNPAHGNHSPTLSVYRADDNRSRWKCFRDNVGGGPVDLYMHIKGADFPTACSELGRMYSIPAEKPGAVPGPRRQQTTAEWIAERCLANARTEAQRGKLLAYLLGRGLSERAVLHAIDRHTLGFNDYVSASVPAGEVNHGGDAVAFVVRDHQNGQVMAVDMRYLEPALNGGVKTQSQGEKQGYPWCSDWRRFAAARRVYLVESAINALSVDTCGIPGVAAVATRGTAVQGLDWRMFVGKQVVLAFDNDKPLTDGPQAGYRPGLKAAWAAHEALLSLDVPALMVDYDDWHQDDDEEEPINDLNDYLQLHGADKLAGALKKLEPWVIPGLPGKEQPGKTRLWLPFHDSQTYWRFRVREDFTSWVSKFSTDEDTGRESLTLENVAGFRVAGLSRVRIASTNSMMTGDKDLSPTTIYSMSVQVPREPSKLLRRVVTDENVHNIEVWKKLGPVFSPASFLRMLNIMERAADIGSRDAINFVGIAWKNGKAVVNEGADCYFTDPAQQCPYHNLHFPSGPAADAQQVVKAYQSTFTGNGAALLLVWALGAHLKAWLGFWPHFSFQAEKGTGKGILSKRLERTVGMTVFSRQAIQTEFRILGSVSYTSHPVGWGEFSANKVDVIARCMHTLQECYQYEYSTRGSEKKEFLVCAPVLLVGEEVDAKTLQGKLVRNHLTKATRGPLMPDDLPPFPVRQWLEFLARVPRAQMIELQRTSVETMRASCMASLSDSGAERMVENYAALRSAWLLLCEFAGLDQTEGHFLRDLTAQMNAHVKDTVADRQPWVWILETLLSEIARGNYRYPFAFDETDDGEAYLAVRTSHVMDHMAREQSLRTWFDNLPVKSDRVFKQQIRAANVLAEDDVEKTVQGRRVAHMVGLSLPALEQYGLYAVAPKTAPNE